MLINKIEYPDLPPVVGVTDPWIAQSVWKALHTRGILSPLMTFSSSLKLNKWNREERLELKSLHISKAPIDGIDEAASIHPGTGSTPVHIALQDQDGHLHGHANLSARPNGRFSNGILTTDRDGYLWFCDAEGADHVTGEEILRPMEGKTNPLMALCAGQPDAPFSLTEQPILAEFMRSGNRISCFTDNMVTREEMEEDQASKFDAALSRINQRLDVICARRDGIVRIVEQHFTDKALSRLVPDMTKDLNKGIVPDYHEFALAKAYNTALGDISLRFMDHLRTEGYCAPCPNNAHREVETMTAWNVWMEGKFEGDDLPFEIEMLRHRLNDSPAFTMIDGIIMRASFEVSDRVWKETHPGEERKYDGGQERVIPAARIPEIFSLAREALLECFSYETDRVALMRNENLRSNDDGTNYVLAGSFLKPELALRPENYSDDPVPLPPLDAPAYVRHMEIPLPSGVLVMADWFRIEGFKEGLVSLCGEDHYDINTAQGLDHRAREYFEKAGVAIVQVGNSSPEAIREAEGIWRMGYFDEDHDEFWTDDGKSSGALKPDIQWKTCTDLWANIFADREAVISVLMASGAYEDRSGAATALDDYIQESYGANSVDLGVTSLHLYAPTGAGIHKQNFNEVFKASEILERDWIEDMYILSVQPLTMDEEILENGEWISLSPNASENTPEP